MKVLFIYCNTFSYVPSIKTLDFVEVMNEERHYEKVQTAFIHVEESDVENEGKVFKKLLKNLKWVTKKNATNKIILHSFAHLSESKAPPEFTKELFNKLQERLTGSGFEVEQTPFGYFLDLKVDAPGFSLARVFKDL